MSDKHPNVADLVKEVAKQFSKDHARKQRLLARSPHIAHGMDAGELGGASSRELAERELKELGIDAGDNDPLALLDAHHAGRQFARDGNRIPGDNRSIGSALDTIEGSSVDQFFASLEGGRHSAQDAASGGIESIIDDYIHPKE